MNIFKEKNERNKCISNVYYECQNEHNQPRLKMLQTILLY